MRAAIGMRALHQLSSKPRTPMIKFPERRGAAPSASSTSQQQPKTTSNQSKPSQNTAATSPGAQKPVVNNAQTSASKSSAAQQQSGADRARYEDIPLSNMRRTIAKRLTESKSTVPHHYLTSEILVDELLKLREKLNADIGESSPTSATEKPHRLSINDFIIKACALSSHRVRETHPHFLATFVSVDISVAVSTDAGLLTPIIFNADTKDLLTISKETRELAARARAGRLQPHEFEGGTFTVSNLGMFDSVEHFTAIINPPQSCILSVGQTTKQLMATDNGPTVAETLKVTLSSDHRSVDGTVAALWLKHFQRFLEQPELLLL